MNEFDEGLRAGRGLGDGLPSTNEGWQGFYQGQRERELAAGWGGNGSSGLGGAAVGAMGPGILMLVILYFVLLGAIGAAISALLGGWVVMLWARAFDRGFNVRYGEAYQAAFASLFVYLAITFVMSMFLSSPGDRAGAQGLRIGTGLIDLRFAASLAAHPGRLAGVWPMLLFLHGPGLLVAAVVLGRLLGGPLGGALRYPRALLTMVSVVVVGIAGTYSLVVFLLIRSDDAKLFNDGVALPTFIGIGAGIVALALVGGPIGAATLLTLTRRLSGARIGNWAHAFATAALALLAFGAASTASAFLFQGSDAFTDLLYRLARERHRQAFYTAHRDEMLSAVPGLLITQLPALVAAATVFATRIRGVYLGVVGFLKALLVATMVAVPPYLIVAAGLFLLVMV